MHGDTWDRFLTDHPVITVVADWFYLNMQRMSRRLAIGAKRKSKTFLRCVDRVRAEATEYAKAKRADVVVCGHTHHAEAPSELDRATPAYFNSGSWTDFHCHYLTVHNGVVRLEAAKVEAVPAAEVPG